MDLIERNFQRKCSLFIACNDRHNFFSPVMQSYGIYSYQLIRFARVFSHVDDFNTRNRVLKAKFLDKDIDIIYFVRLFKILSAAF